MTNDLDATIAYSDGMPETWRDQGWHYIGEVAKPPVTIVRCVCRVPVPAVVNTWLEEQPALSRVALEPYEITWAAEDSFVVYVGECVTCRRVYYALPEDNHADPEA